MLKLLLIVGWIICSIITAGIVIYIDHDDGCVEDAWVYVFVCFTCWPFLIAMSLLIFVMNKLAALPIFVAGFIAGIRKEKQDDISRTKRRSR